MANTASGRRNHVRARCDRVGQVLAIQRGRSFPEDRYASILLVISTTRACATTTAQRPPSQMTTHVFSVQPLMPLLSPVASGEADRLRHRDEFPIWIERDKESMRRERGEYRQLRRPHEN